MPVSCGFISRKRRRARALAIAVGRLKGKRVKKKEKDECGTLLKAARECRGWRRIQTGEENHGTDLSASNRGISIPTPLDSEPEESNGLLQRVHWRKSVFAPAPEEDGQEDCSSLLVTARKRRRKNAAQTSDSDHGIQLTASSKSIYAPAPSDSELEESNGLLQTVEKSVFAPALEEEQEESGSLLRTVRERKKTKLLKTRRSDDFEQDVDDESLEDEIIDLIANDDHGDDDWEYVRTAQKTSELRYCSASHQILLVECLTQLQREGLVVIDNALSKCKLRQAVQDCMRLQSHGFFGDSPNENEDIRSDRVHFLTSEDRRQREEQQQSILGEQYVVNGRSPMTGKEKGLLYVQGFLKGLGSAFEAYKFDGWQEGRQSEKSARPIVFKVPDPVQLAMYRGSGARYSIHRDGAEEGSTDPDMEAYSLRVVTAILYLNDASDPWDARRHGGCLRCYMGASASDKTGSSAKKTLDIEPIGGRLVLFSSQTILHEVMPTYRDRYAATVWFLREEAETCSK